MTVADNYAPAVFTGNGVTTVFPFSFVVYDESHLLVYEKVIATGVRTLISSANYTVSGVPGTGDVTYAPGGSPLPATKQLELVRLVPYTQALDIENQGGFFANTLEEQLDLTTMQIQQLADASADYLELAAAVEAAEAAQTAAEAAQTAAEAAKTGAETAETNAETAETAAEAARDAALAAQTAAELAETNAETAETNAETAETNAETAATNANNSAIAAAASAVTASAEAAAAAISETNAATSETNAAASAAAAAASAASIVSVPAGGLTSQVLSKLSNTDHDIAWVAAGAGDLIAANNLSDVANAATARTNLGLGTAAVKNIGTSGDAVPLLNAVNSWSAPQVIASSTADLRLDKTASGDLGRILGYTAGSLRWVIEMSDAVAESGSNAGSNFNIKSRTDAGGALTTPISIARATGIVVMAHGATVGDTSGDPVVIKGTTVASFSSGLLDNVDAAAWRTDLGLGSAAVLTAGDASGNLKTLNADGGFTFATTATNTNVAGVNVGVWKTAHRIDSYDAATYAGNRTTMAILRGFAGSGENGPTRSDTALHLEAEQDNWLTTSVLGESDTLRVFMRKGANGDCAGMLMNVSKVESASYGSLVWEASSSWVQAATGTVLRQIRSSTGHQGPASDLRGGGTGFNTTASTGDNGIAFAALQDHLDTGRWKYPFLGADGYANGDEYFYVTGPAHANGKGQLYTSALATIAGDVAAPAGGSTAAVLRLSNLSTFGIYFGTGVPTVSAAKGSLYMRRDGTSTNNRAYINTDGGTTWTALTTVA